MTTDQFCYWLRGFTELAETETLSPKQWEVVKRHLELVFSNITEENHTTSNRSFCSPQSTTGFYYTDLRDAVENARLSEEMKY